MAAIGDQMILEDQSNFWTAVPYAVGTLAVAGSGLAVAVTSGGSTAAIITGVALGIIGAYAFYGVVGTAFATRNPQEFKEKVWKGMATGIGAGVAETVRIAMHALINAFVQKAVFGPNSR